MVFLLSFSLTPQKSDVFLVLFHSVLFCNNRPIRSVFSECVGTIFAMFCIAPRNDFNSVLDVGGFICRMDLLFYLLVFRPFCDFRAPAWLFFRERIPISSDLLCIRFLESVQIL